MRATGSRSSAGAFAIRQSADTAVLTAIIDPLPPGKPPALQLETCVSQSSR